MMGDINSIAKDLSKTVHKQGDNLHKIEDNLDDVQKTVKKADKALNDVQQT